MGIRQHLDIYLVVSDDNFQLCERRMNEGGSSVCRHKNYYNIISTMKCNKMCFIGYVPKSIDKSFVSREKSL